MTYHALRYVIPSVVEGSQRFLHFGRNDRSAVEMTKEGALHRDDRKTCQVKKEKGLWMMCSKVLSLWGLPLLVGCFEFFEEAGVVL